MRWVIILAAALAIHCKSIPINQKIEDQNVKNEKAKEIAQKYIPEGELLDTVTGALDGSSKLLRETNKEREKEKAAKEKETLRADKNEGAARLIFWSKIGGGIILVGLAIYGVKKLGSKIPLIGRLFGG